MSEVVIPKILRDNLEYNVVSGVFTRCGQELGGVNSKYTTIRYLGKAVKAHWCTQVKQIDWPARR